MKVSTILIPGGSLTVHLDDPSHEVEAAWYSYQFGSEGVEVVIRWDVPETPNPQRLPEHSSRR